ncbi:hypothetical protein B0I00_3334 [Novosphingobium kunmingense]|uniref:Uncharacterized protein n=1 Tax=Novosphingobium kunmingense TaxID=1211806 RepID=A0A2N0H302_9SPHN|nr:hypothetical protein B0I00_3334 [Novosphingobium kunmingense]
MKEDRAIRIEFAVLAALLFFVVAGRLLLD